MAREFLGQQGVEIEQTVEARQVAIGPEEAWNLLAGATVIRVGRGAKVEVVEPGKCGREGLLALVLGRSNTLRAPSLKVGSEFLVGYNQEMYRLFFKA